MSKRKHSNYKAQDTVKATQQKANDAYTNQPANLGWGALNLQESVDYPLTRLTMDYMKLQSMYRSNGLLRRIVDKPVEDACTHWFKIDSQITPDQEDAIEKCLRQTHIKFNFERGLKWGRLFGGAAGLIMIDGQGDTLDQPLDLHAVEPGSFRGIYIVDRWSGIYPGLEIVNDISDPEFGLPEYYIVRTSEDAGIETRVHHSRVIRFPGEELSFWETQFEQYWGASVIETVYDELRMYDNTLQNIANLVFQANVWVRKVDGIEQLLAQAPPSQQNRLYEALKSQQRFISSFHTLIIGDKDDMSNKSYGFAGLSDVMETFMAAMSAVTHIPQTILFGRSPAGMDATGESDLENYYTFVNDSIQENKMRPGLEKLMPIICISELGAIPDDLNIRFNPLHGMTEGEKADFIQKRATTVNELFVSGLMPQQVALKELKDMSETTGAFSNITDDDIKQADQTPDIGDTPPVAQKTLDSDFDESKHPRRSDGKFGNGGENDSEKSRKPIDNEAKKEYSNLLLNCKTSDGIAIKHLSTHSLERISERKIRPEAIKHVLQSAKPERGNTDRTRVYDKDHIRVVVDFAKGEIVTIAWRRQAK